MFLSILFQSYLTKFITQILQNITYKMSLPPEYKGVQALYNYLTTIKKYHMTLPILIKQPVIGMTNLAGACIIGITNH